MNMKVTCDGHALMDLPTWSLDMQTLKMVHAVEEGRHCSPQPYGSSHETRAGKLNLKLIQNPTLQGYANPDQDANALKWMAAGCIIGVHHWREMFEPEEPESKNESKMWYSQLVGPSLKDFGEGKWRAVVPVDNILCCPPWNATHVLRINTTDPEQLQIEATGCDLGSGKGKWKSGVLGADGNIYCPPWFASRVLRIDPYVGTSELIGPEFTLPDPVKLAQDFGDSIGDGDGDVSDESWGKWMDGTLAANGCLYCQPWCASHVLKIDTRNGSVELIGPDLGWAPDKYRAAVVATDGVIYCPPHSARRVMKLEIATDTVSFVGPDYGTKPGKWWAGAMTLVNTIVCAPHSAGQVLQIDLFRQMCTLVGRDFGSGEAKYRSIVQSNDGCFYCPPCNAPQVLCIDPLTPDADYVGPDLCCGGFKWVVAGLGEDGCVYSPPWLAHKSLRVDVPTRWARQIGKNQGWGGGKWEAMYPHEDGFFYCPPCCATDTLSLDTLIGTTELLTPELGKEPRKWRCTGRSAAGELYCPPFEHDKVLRLTFKNLQLDSPSGTKDSPLSRASSRVQESRASSLLQG
ncbi:unnamed protein product [Symbiodinium sp. CCMP2456]|nr:unnamed protein product [Symbiodinium sp. CCMP2456]